MFSEGIVIRGTDDEMILQPDIQQLPSFFYPRGNLFIWPGRNEDSRWVIVRENDFGGMGEQGQLHELGDIDQTAIWGPFTQHRPAMWYKPSIEQNRHHALFVRDNGLGEALEGQLVSAL